jgi:MSHA biogenesis protein MshK
MALRLIFMLMSMSLAVHAENLPDPTRPPANLDGGATLTAQPSGPALQVIRTINGRRSAMISGQEVKSGSKLGDAVVMRIDEDRVLLRGPDGIQTLKLFPEVEKRPVAVSNAQAKPRAKIRVNRPHKKVKRKEAE